MKNNSLAIVIAVIVVGVFLAPTTNRPKILIKKHSYIQDPSGGRGQRCVHCGNYGETDLGWSSYTPDSMCIERLIDDPFYGLTKEEYEYFTNWSNYSWNPYYGKWNKRYDSKLYTTKQLKEYFKNNILKLL